MKRILIFSLAYYPDRIGGAEIAIKEITDRVSDVEFHMVTLRFNSSEAREEKIGNVMVHRVGAGSAYFSKIFFIPLAARQGMQLLRERHFDGAWAMMSYMLLPLILMRMRGVRIPYALTLQEGDSYEHVFGRWYIKPIVPLLDWGFRDATVVQAISTYLSHWARTRGFTGPLEIIPNAVNTKQFSKRLTQKELSVLKERLGTKDGDTLLITSSRLVYKNAVDDVLRALALLPPSVSFLVLGRGPDEAMLKKLAEKLGVSSRVKFFGHIPNEEMPGYLQAADIFVRPSRSEGFGISFIEVFAAGLPVVATQEGGIADFLFDAKRNSDKPTTGWAVDANAPEQIAAAVKDILGSPDAVKRVTAHARKLAFEKYDWDFIVEDVRTKVFSRLYTSMRGKRIVLAAGLYPPDIGGPATFAKQLTESLRAAGAEVAVVPFRTVRSMPPILRHIIYAMQLLSKEKASAVVALDPVSVGLPALFSAWLLGARFILRVGGDYAWEQGVQRFGITEMLDEFVTSKKSYPLQVRLLRDVQRFVARRAQYVVVPSEYLGRIVAQWGVRQERVVCIYSAVEPIAIRPDRSALGLHAKEKIIFSAGRFVPWKGFDGLINAVSTIDGVKLYIAGSGPLYTSLHKKASDRVIFLGDLSRATLMQWLAVADIFALNTGYEGLSHQIIEAMQLGIPVVTTRVGGNEELIQDGVTGRLVAYNDVSALTAAITEVLNTPSEAHAMATVAKRRIMEHFSAEGSFNRWVSLLR